MVVKCDRLPHPGQTVTGGKFVVAAGGKGANQAVAAARLGAHVVFVARVGTDSFGQEALRGYEAEGIDTQFVVRDPDDHTGVALIMVDASGENMIAVASGANHRLTAADVRRAESVIARAGVVLVQLEIPWEAVRTAVKLAYEHSVPVILNPAPAVPLDDDLLSRVSYLTPNESEAEGLTGIRVVDEATADQAAEALLKRGVRHVIITLGARGAFLATQERKLLIPAFKVNAVDTTAAGDAFNGALAVALARGLSLEAAIEFSAKAGAVSVTRMGAQPSLPREDEIAEFSAERVA